MARFDRRTLLKLFAAASTRALAGCGGEESVWEAGSRLGNGKSVVVLGGGLAGLSAAYELVNRGYTVTVLEAQTRPGGRVFTMRSGWDNNQYAEIGATRIPDTHNYTLSYAQQFGLTLREFPEGPSLYYLKGKRFIHTDGDLWPSDVLTLTDAEAQKGADPLIFDYENLAELGNPLDPDWPTGTALNYNNIGYTQYLLQKGASSDVNVINQACNGTEILRDGALFWLMTDVMDAAWNKTYAIAGGNDQLPWAFANALGSVIKYGCIVKGISQTQSAVTVTYVAQDGHTRTLTADYCVCALPFSILRKIPITPGLPADKTNVIQNIPMMSVSRCYMQTSTRFWNQQGIGGLKIARTDTAIERLWDHTAVQDGPTGLIQAYMMDANAEAFAAKAPSQRLSWVKNTVAPFFPEIQQQVTNSAIKIWQQDPYALGAWAYHKPGQTAQMFPAAKRREGLLFFCGEHTSPWAGWMQGALESANRVVSDITNS